MFTCCSILSAIVWGIFNENQFSFFEFLRFPAEPLDGGVSAASCPADPVAQGVVGPIQEPVVKINPEKRRENG
jgi:hypothetical protein